ncbi:hypothetical protein ACHAPJ_006993 [Fusarium lateritium]
MAESGGVWSNYLTQLLLKYEMLWPASLSGPSIGKLGEYTNCKDSYNHNDLGTTTRCSHNWRIPTWQNSPKSRSPTKFTLDIIQRHAATLEYEKQSAYDYTISFAKPSRYVSLMECIPGIKRIVDEDGPAVLCDFFRNLNPEMQNAIKCMNDISAGVHFIHGVAGCGKSFLMEFIIACAIYGHHEKDVDLTMAEPKDFTTLYLLNNNVGIENQTTRLGSTFSSMGFTKAPSVTRVYPMDADVRSGNRKATPNNASPDLFQREVAEAEHKQTVNHFLAQVVLDRLSIDIHNAHDALLPNSKHMLARNSLES